MKLIRFFWIAPLLGFLTLAQARNLNLADGDQPINIQANAMTLDNTNRKSTFEGNVRMTQGSIKITASRIELTQDTQAMATIRAWGRPVTFQGRSAQTNKLVQGWSDQVEYKETEGSIVLTGNARLISEGDEIRAQTIRYFRTTGQYKADGARTDIPVFVTIQPRNRDN